MPIEALMGIPLLRPAQIGLSQQQSKESTQSEAFRP